MHSLVVLFSLFALGLAHKSPKTAEEIEVQRRLQSAAYYCAPAIAQFTAERQREFAQKVMTGRPELPGYDSLFSAYEDLNPKQDTLLSCNAVQRDPEIQNNTCVLTPVVNEGPYYHKEGHPIRQNIVEYQDGLMLLLDIGVIDVNTCKPLPNVLVDIWQANATGHYAGHPGPEPGRENEKPIAEGKLKGYRTPYPRSRPEETFLRGAWPTDEHGVAQFITIFPGYYSGRSIHIHTKVFTEWETLPKGTFKSDKLAHVGQFFFDDEITEEIVKMYPYSMNPIQDTVGRTRNWEDALNIFQDSHSPEGEYNPIFKLELLGGIVRQGLIGYITMGINSSAVLHSEWKAPI